jgi:uncharacterized protein (TIGR02147 family)
MKEQAAVRNILKSRLENLRIRYPNYSLRAFAKKTGVSPATLSLLLQGKRKISEKLASSLCERLLLDPQERSEVLGGFIEAKAKERDSVSEKKQQQYVQLTMDQYRVISDWRSFALLNLIKTVDFKNDTKWMAERLNLPPAEIKETLQRLTRLGMIEEKKGQISRTVSQYRTTDDISSLSLKNSHRQTLELAQASLEKDHVDIRDFTWVTMPMDLTKLPQAKTLIRKFQDDMSDLMEEKTKPTEVYRLSIQLFPLTNVKKTESKND